MRLLSSFLFPGSLEINNSIVLIGNLETILDVEEEDAFEDCDADVVQLQISIVVQPINDFTDISLAIRKD